MGRGPGSAPRPRPASTRTGAAKSAPSAGSGGDRLQKVLAHAGVASRRAAEELILAGRVQVNGAVVRTLGTTVDPAADEIRVDGRRVAAPARAHTYVMLHKPVGVVSTAADPEGRETVLHLVDVPERVYPVGRLDLDSEGLVLLTDDGDLTYHLTQARFGVDKEYEVLVDGFVDQRDVRALTNGVKLDDGLARAVRSETIAQTPDGTWLKMVMHEGRKREVRRMLWALGYRVLRLRRVRLGSLALGRLGPGAWRHLRPEEVARLRVAAGLPKEEQ